MAIFNKHAAAALTIAIVIGFCCLVRCDFGDPDVTVVSYGCSEQKYSTDDTDYDTGVTQVMSNLVDVTPTNYDSYVVDPWTDFTIFGRGTCNMLLSEIACTACIYIATKKLTQSCPMSVGARIQLGDCSIRYEDYQFTE